MKHQNLIMPFIRETRIQIYVYFFFLSSAAVTSKDNLFVIFE